jgi:hypothetical protein
VATLSVIDGFEHGKVGTGNTGPYSTPADGTPTIVTSPVRTGARALQVSPAGAVVRRRYAHSTTIVSMAFYVRFAALPTADVTLAEFNHPTNPSRVKFMGAGSDKFNINVVSGTNADAAQTVAVDTWYRIVAEFDTSTGTATARMRVDNGTEVSASLALASAAQTGVQLGTSAAETFTAFYDDWLISVTDGDYEEMSSWTSHQVESLIPTSDGTHNITTSGDFDSFTGTAFSNATTTGHTFIGHRPLQLANTANQVIRQELGTTANYMEMLLGNLADNTKLVAGVKAHAAHVEAATSGASLGEARLLLSDNTEVLTTGSLSVINSTEDPGATVTYRHRMTIAPAGGWDGTKVDGLKARVGFADNAPDVNFIDFMVEVAQYVADTEVDLVIEDGAHAHTADILDLTQVHNLVVADALHGHAADNVVLTFPAITLTIADALHAHIGDSVAITQQHVLVIADALHAHVGDNLTLIQQHALAIADAIHAHVADGLALTQVHVLAILDAIHGHTADNLVLETEGAADLVIADATHGHSADSLTITQAHVLAIADALHAHAADTPALTQIHTLVIQDALHGHASDPVTLSGDDIEPPALQDIVRLRQHRKWSRS